MFHHRSTQIFLSTFSAFASASSTKRDALHDLETSNEKVTKVRSDGPFVPDKLASKHHINIHNGGHVLPSNIGHVETKPLRNAISNEESNTENSSTDADLFDPEEQLGNLYLTRTEDLHPEVDGFGAGSNDCPDGYDQIGGGAGAYGKNQFGFDALVLACLYESCPYTQAPKCWDTSRVTNMSNAFSNLKYFDEDISKWNTSRVTDMSSMFSRAGTFNKDISSWDTSQVKNMHAMFEGALAFDQDLNSWKTSGVSDMGEMFQGARDFNGDISSWDTSKVKTMQAMFDNALSFDQDISGWETSMVNDMSRMFYLSPFNQDIGGWITSSATSMEGMLMGCFFFDQDLSKWDVSSVTNMRSMFSDTPQFNSPLLTWDVSSVETMEGMFQRSYQFNQPIGLWEPSNVTSMTHMFYDAKSFNQVILPMSFESIEFTKNMFVGSDCPCQLNSSPKRGPWCQCLDMEPGSDQIEDNHEESRILQFESMVPSAVPTLENDEKGSKQVTFGTCGGLCPELTSSITQEFENDLCAKTATDFGIPVNSIDCVIASASPCGSCSTRRRLQASGPTGREFVINFLFDVPEEDIPTVTEFSSFISDNLGSIVEDTLDTTLNEETIVVETLDASTSAPTSVPTSVPTSKPSKGSKKDTKKKKDKKDKKDKKKDKKDKKKQDDEGQGVPNEPSTDSDYYSKAQKKDKVGKSDKKKSDKKKR